MSYGNNVFAPMGLQPSQYQNGSTWNGQTSQYPLVSAYGTSLFRGDPITWDTNGTIKIGVAGSGIIGVFWGVQYTDSTGAYQFAQYWNANTVTSGSANATAFVIDDPNILFDIVVSNSTAAAPFYVAAVDLGRNANFSVANSAGSTISGNSGYYLDANSIGNGATLSLKIIRLTPVPGNQFGTNSNTVQYNNVLVKINNDVYQGGTGTAGAH